METNKLSPEEVKGRVNSAVMRGIFAAIENEKLKKMQEFNEVVERQQKLLNEGGWVRRETKRQSGWKYIPWYFHIIMIIYTAAVIFLSILQVNILVYIGDYRFVSIDENIFISVCLFYVTCLSVYVKFLIEPYVSGRDFYVHPIEQKTVKPQILGTGNGIGFKFFGSYRNICDTYVTYYCFCIFMPIIPICCYRVTSGDTKYELGRGYSTGYKILCLEDSNFLEIVDLYILGIAGISFASCLLILIFYFVG